MVASAAPLAIGHQDDVAAARRDFLHVGDGLLEYLIERRDHDDRHVLVDQRNRPVLEFAGGIALGVDVGDFLQLQRAFQRQRIAGAAAEIEHVAALAISRASFSICGSVASAAAIRRGISTSAMHELGLVRVGQFAACPARRDRERGQHHQLAGESLGRGDADFGTGQRRQHGLALARDGRGRHVDDRQRVRAVRLRIAQRGQRVGGFAGLRNEDRQIALGATAPRGSGTRRRRRFRPAARASRSNQYLAM